MAYFLCQSGRTSAPLMRVRRDHSLHATSNAAAFTTSPRALSGAVRSRSPAASATKLVVVVWRQPWECPLPMKWRERNILLSNRDGVSTRGASRIVWPAITSVLRVTCLKAEWSGCSPPTYRNEQLLFDRDAAEDIRRILSLLFVFPIFYFVSIFFVASTVWAVTRSRLIGRFEQATRRDQRCEPCRWPTVCLGTRLLTRIRR